MNAELEVAVVRGERSIQTVRRALELIGGVSRLSGKPVLIKVNFITTKTWDTGATTDPIVVEALIRELQPINKSLYVVESDATFTNADKAARATGVLDLCEKYGVPFINLTKVKEKVMVKLDSPETLSKIKLPRIVLESRIVSAAKMKTHEETKVTLGMKNMFGLMPNKLKMRYHVKGIEKVIVDINSVVRPTLTVIDGFVALEGKGPVSGTPVRMDLVVAGWDAVATDAAASMIMGFNPNDIYHIKRAADRGMGRIEGFKVVGERIQSVARAFKRS